MKTSAKMSYYKAMRKLIPNLALAIALISFLATWYLGSNSEKLLSYAANRPPISSNLKSQQQSTFESLPTTVPTLIPIPTAITNPTGSNISIAPLGATLTPVRTATNSASVNPTNNPIATIAPGSTSSPLTPARTTSSSGLPLCPVDVLDPIVNCECDFSHSPAILGSLDEGYGNQEEHYCSYPTGKREIVIHSILPSTYSRASQDHYYIMELGGTFANPTDAAIGTGNIIDQISREKTITKAQYDQKLAGNCYQVCIGFDKPVIYLYPEIPTKVDVKVTLTGEITKSVPKYDKEGWQNILAFPDGTFNYQGEIFSELFYETNVTTNYHTPGKKVGTLLERSHLSSTLFTYITKLGLNEYERSEFLEYWLPRLEKEKSRYVFVRQVPQNEKDIIDNVLINPKPDTFIYVLVEFYPTNTRPDFKQFEFPQIPAREGFTAVEWGGSVIYSLL